MPNRCRYAIPTTETFHTGIGGRSTGRPRVLCRLKRESEADRVEICAAHVEKGLDRSSGAHEDCPLDETGNWSACDWYEPQPGPRAGFR